MISRDPTLPLRAPGEPAPSFRGADFRPDLDRERLTVGLLQTLDVMSDGAWRTKGDVRDAILARFSCDVCEESIGRYMRYAREERNGGWTVERRRAGDPAGGLYEYRFVQKEGRS